ncbi:MAG TPA: hypothetical protein VFV98_15770 [Vicinamibacterales bacterium]|nr:hypothetical protein [Vicinamibacterales bacterium]
MKIATLIATSLLRTTTAVAGRDAENRPLLGEATPMREAGVAPGGDRCTPRGLAARNICPSGSTLSTDHRPAPTRQQEQHDVGA